MGWLGPAVAGTWYPANPAKLRREVEEHLGSTRGAEVAAKPLVLIAPHAGYVYSGEVAGTVFRLLRAMPVERVLLLGPTHYFGFHGVVVPRASAYRTPLGDAPIDRGAAEDLGARPGFRMDDRPFEPEHSLEAEIPFLQRILSPGWCVVPVLVGEVAPGREAEDFAGALAPLITPRTLVVISSDFTHYGARFGYVPFRSDVPEGIRRIDMDAIRFIEAGDADAFAAYVGETGATICGRRPIEIGLRLLGPDARGCLVAYDTSGRMTNDWAHSVSYASVALWRESGGD